ncbi:piggyBac transposable element-derived protein 4-like [Temnothorax longispinosus]|uniref:piggyBac transposable element-derived protein 4-like n=1 Tax=Temnothorax longispinosus TaxID=300112 RepID=UPI003A9A26C9
MSCDRFLLILRALHFAKNPDNDGVASADRLYKIRNIVNFFNSRMSEIFSPGREISLDLDESMILWRGRQCTTTNKCHKYGIKLYMLTTSEGIILKLMAYTGMLDDRDRKGHSEKVVMNLLQGMLDVGHSLYINNYYNSYELMKRLTDRKTYCTGTIKSNGKSFPAEVRDKKLKKGKTIAKYANGIMIGKWKDKRDVAYISNEHKNYMVKVQNKRKETKSKPLPIISYNKYMSGIDGQDQMLTLANYPRKRKTFTWYSKIFVHILQLKMINTHQLYNKYSGFKIPLYNFCLEIIRHLLNFHFDSDCDPGIVEHPLKTLTEEGKIMRKGLHCHNCSLRRKSIPTDYVCTICQGAPGYCLDCAKITHV